MLPIAVRPVVSSLWAMSRVLSWIRSRSSIITAWSHQSVENVSVFTEQRCNIIRNVAARSRQTHTGRPHYCLVTVSTLGTVIPARQHTTWSRLQAVTSCGNGSNSSNNVSCDSSYITQFANRSDDWLRLTVRVLVFIANKNIMNSFSL